MKVLVPVLALAVLISGCAGTPPVSARYYLTATTVNLTLTQTVGCDGTNLPKLASTVTATATNFADRQWDQKDHFIDYKAMDGTFANSEATVEWTGDRRLKTINASSEGVGEAVVKAAISLATAAKGGKPTPELQQACRDFKIAFPSDPLTVISHVQLVFDPKQEIVSVQPFVPDPLSANSYATWKKLIGNSCLTLSAEPAVKTPIVIGAGGSAKYIKIDAREPAVVQMKVASGYEQTCPRPIDDLAVLDDAYIWAGTAAVGQLGKPYELALPKARAFGKQSVGVTFDDTGALVLLKYSKDSGTASALGATQTLVDALVETRAEKTADLTSQADLIAAQQKLIKCQTTPGDC